MLVGKLLEPRSTNRHSPGDGQTDRQSTGNRPSSPVWVPGLHSHLPAPVTPPRTPKGTVPPPGRPMSHLPICTAERTPGPPSHRGRSAGAVGEGGGPPARPLKVVHLHQTPWPRPQGWGSAVGGVRLPSPAPAPAPAADRQPTWRCASTQACASFYFITKQPRGPPRFASAN